MRIVITECDHDSFEEESAAADVAGAELIVTQSHTRDEIVSNAEGADGLVVQYARIDGDVLDALPGVRAVGRYGVGVDTIDLDAATERGVVVTNVPDYGTEAVSDHTIALALSAAREIPRLDRRLRDGRVDFPGIRPVHLVGGRVFGVLGMGLIGRATARKARGLGYEVIYHDVRSTVDAEGYERVGLEELLERSSVISVHTPLTDATRHLIGRDELAIMRSDAILVNTSRGGVVDTDALVGALRAGRIRSAALDVTETEPLPRQHELFDLPQVTLTPHMAWYSEETYGALKRRTVENVARVLAGDQPKNVVNPEVLGTEQHLTLASARRSNT